MRIFAFTALTLTAAIVFAFWGSQGHWLQGLIYSAFPGSAGIACLPHKEQSRPQVHHSVTRTAPQRQENHS